MVVPAKVSLRRPPGKPGPGHFQTYDRPRHRHANGRFGGTAVIGRRPLEGAHSPKRSIKGPRRLSTPDEGRTSAVRPAELELPTLSCPWPISRRTTGLPWHLTFDHAAEKVSDGDSGRSRVATIARQRIPAERLHPKATNWRSRPEAAGGTFQAERPLHSASGRRPQCRKVGVLRQRSFPGCESRPEQDRS
jgi:hypothetical protein